MARADKKKRQWLRRDFLGIAGGAAGSMLLPRQALAAPTLSVQPAAFEVTPEGALVWVSGDAGLALAVEIASDEAMSQPRRIPATALTRDNDYTGPVTVDGLTPDTTWFYRVVDIKSGKPASRTGRFRTAPLQPRPFTFAWSGDMQEHFQPFRLFDAIGATGPDFFLHLGDTIYADAPRSQFHPSLKHYRRKHYANRADSHLQKFLLRHPTYATWDDHETDNDTHAGHPFMPVARQAFKEYWPCRCVASDGIYRRFSWAGIDFFVLDTRSYRSAPNVEDIAGKTMLGAAQKEWLLSGLGSSNAPFKFVCTPTPFQGGGQDTWGGYRTERNEIIAFLRARKIAGVVFLTADYHLARDWTNPKMPFRDFMAGPIATHGFFWHHPTARERYEKAGGFLYDGYNFGLVKLDPQEGRGEVSFVDHEGKAMHTIAITA